MRVLILNLPNKVKIVRRYMCSYNAQNFLFPPHDLLSLCGIARGFEGVELKFIDAIAEEMSSRQCLEEIGKFAPGYIATLAGFECFGEDMEEIGRIKAAYPLVKVILCGHYPTVFPNEVMEGSRTDIVMKGEPELVFQGLLQQLRHGGDLCEVPGLVYRSDAGEEWKETATAGRIPQPDELPLPAYDLMKHEAYSEPFMPKPFGLIQSARGCPYVCNYCVKSFGTKLTVLSPENLLQHIVKLKETFGIRSLRFIDDTFTAIPSRVIQICKLMIDENVDLKWTCLARPDTLNRDMLGWMKRAGCVRVNIGIESGSQHVLDLLNKKLNVDEALANIRAVREAGMETMGFFLVGVPGERDEDVLESIAFAKAAKFNFITVSKLTLYPGTGMYDAHAAEIDFQLLPYRNEFKDKAWTERAERWVREFYKRYYLSAPGSAGLFLHTVNHPVETFMNTLSLTRYLMRRKLRGNVRSDYI